MSYLKLENNAKTTLQAAITAGATSLTVTSASLFPTSGDFLITIWNSSTYSDPGDDSNMEILLVTVVSGTTFTVTRAQESTVAKAHSSGNAVQMLITAGILEEIQDAIKDNFSELDDTPASYSGHGGKGIRVKGAEDGIEFYVPTDLDEKIKISSNDTTANYLNGKLVAGTGITLTEIGDGGDETLSIINNDKGSDAISAHEITYDHSNLHSHANKALLDTYTQTEVNLADAVSKKHTQNTDIKLDNGGANEVSASNLKTRQVHFSLDGSGSPLTTGVKSWTRAGFSGTIVGWELTADQPGNIVIDVWKDVFVNFPPTVADTIIDGSGAVKPTLSSARTNSDDVLTGWSTTITAGDYLMFYIDSASTVTKIVLILEIEIS